MPAPAAPLSPPARTPDPATGAALSELLQLGLAVARVASHLAEMEDRALHALAEAAAETTRAAHAPSASLADAIQAGRNADTTDAARDAVAARVASITESFDKAARAVRRTALLQARLADPRPVRPAPWQERPSAPATPAPRRPANDAERPERPDTPEWGDELGNRPDDEILHDIRRDLAGAAATLPDAPRPAPLKPAIPAVPPDTPPTPDRPRSEPRPPNLPPGPGP